MAGFGPTASFPTASVSGGGTGGYAGTAYSPDPATIIVGAAGVPTVEGISPIVVMQLVRETLRDGGSPPLVVMQLVRETLRSAGDGDTQIVTRQMIRETLRSASEGNTEIVTRQMIREILRSSDVGGTMIVTRQMVRETLRSTAEDMGGRKMSLM